MVARGVGAGDAEPEREGRSLPGRRLALAGGLGLLVCGCGGDALDRGDRQLEPPAPVPVLGSEEGFVRLSCTFQPRRRVQLELLASFEPPAADSPDPAAGTGHWAPVTIREIVPYGDGFIVLDWAGGELVRLRPDLTYDRTFAATGDGPNEVRGPVAAAVSADTLWVLDERLGSLIAYDASLREARRIRLPRPHATDVAALADGSLVLFEPVRFDLLRMAEEDARQFVLTRLGANGEVAARAWEIRADSLRPPRFVLPGPTTGGVVSADSLLVVLLPSSGLVDIRSAHDLRRVHFSTRTCVSSPVSKAYERQLARVIAGQHAPRFVTTWYDHASDVRLRPDGVLTVINPTPDEEGHPHLDLFDADVGRAIGSVQLDLGIDLSGVPHRMQFADAAGDDLIVYDGLGRIWLFRMPESALATIPTGGP